MTDKPILTYRREWYQFTQITFQLRAASLVSPRTWAGGSNVYGPHAQVWMPEFTATDQEIDVWPEIAAFFHELGGQAGLLRLGDASRLQCRYNREKQRVMQGFSDGTGFTDGTLFLDGMMPPLAHLIASAKRGDTFVKIGGLLPSTMRALSRGDMLEFRAGGIADAIPRLHSVTLQGNTNSNGECGVKIMPPLRANLAAGDQVVLDNPTTVFHLVDDTQGKMQISVPNNASFGFSLVEAIENI